MPTGTISNEGLMEKEERTASAGVEKAQRLLSAANYLWSRRMRLLVWTVAGTLLSALLALRICKFEATVQIMPPDSSPGGGVAALAVPSLLKSPGLAGLAGIAGDMLGIKTTGALYTKVLQSRTVEDNLIDHFDLRKHYFKKYWEDARDKLHSHTTITEDKKSGVISVTVSDSDPKLAADLAAAYVRELDLIMLQTSTSAARRERIFIEQRLQEEKKSLDEAERRFSQFASSSMALDIPQQTRVMVEAAARLQGEMIAARAELQGLEQIYTGENTRVRTLRTRVNELQREMDRLNLGNPGNPGSGDSPGSPYPSVKKLPLVGLEWTNLYRNTKIRETVYELLTQQYEVAQIQEAKEIPTVKVLDKAVVPERRHPSPKRVVAIGALMSAMLACLGLLLQHRWQERSADDPWRILLASVFPGKKDVTAM